MSSDSTDNLTESIKGKGYGFFKEFIVDILGAFFPGLLFVVGLVMILFPTLVIVNASICRISSSLLSKQQTCMTFTTDSTKSYDSTHQVDSTNTGVTVKTETITKIILKPKVRPTDLQQNNSDFIVKTSDLIKIVINSTKDTPSTFWFFIFLGLISLIYILGQLFYRHDPKIPDIRSFKKAERKELLKNTSSTNVIKNFLIWVFPNMLKYPKNDAKKKEIEERLQNSTGCTNASECEFPYPYLHKYLESRGLNYLVGFVTWKQNKKNRSKVYINILKTRLQLFSPASYNTITKTEGHIRLSSSTWYVSNVLRNIALISILIFLFPICAIFIKSTFWGNEFLKLVISNIIGPLTILIGSHFCKSSIEDFIHYQRMREIVQVLECAYSAFKSNPAILDPPFDQQKIYFEKHIKEIHHKKNNTQRIEE